MLEPKEDAREKMRTCGDEQGRTNGEHVRRLRADRLVAVLLDVLLRVDRDVLERVHGAENVRGVRLFWGENRDQKLVSGEGRGRGGRGEVAGG